MCAASCHIGDLAYPAVPDSLLNSHVPRKDHGGAEVDRHGERREARDRVDVVGEGCGREIRQAIDADFAEGPVGHARSHVEGLEEREIALQVTGYAAAVIAEIAGAEGRADSRPATVRRISKAEPRAEVFQVVVDIGYAVARHRFVELAGGQFEIGMTVVVFDRVVEDVPTQTEVESQ